MRGFQLPRKKGGDNSIILPPAKKSYIEREAPFFSQDPKL